jgi:hypothetical protein
VKRRPLLTTVVAGLAGLAALIAFPAAATAGSTTTTFSLTGGALSIGVPASTVNLGSAATGASTLSGQLGNVTVTDDRGVLLGTWASQVSASNFTTGGGTSSETISVGNVSYWSGPATAVTGTATFTPGQATSASEIALGTSGQTAFSASAVVGNNSASWNPHIGSVDPGGRRRGNLHGHRHPHRFVAVRNAGVPDRQN